MSESLSLLLEGGSSGGGGGDEGGGVIGVFVHVEFYLTEPLFSSVVESLLTCSWLMSTSVVDGPLQIFVRKSDWSISSKAVFGGGRGGVLLHVLVRASGYFGGRLPLETSPSSLPPVDI